MSYIHEIRPLERVLRAGDDAMGCREHDSHNTRSGCGHVPAMFASVTCGTTTRVAGRGERQRHNSEWNCNLYIKPERIIERALSLMEERRPLGSCH